MEEDSDTRAVLRHATKGHGASIHGRVLEFEEAWHLSLRLLRPGTLQIRNQIRFRHRLAELLGTDPAGKRERTGRRQPVQSPCRGAVPTLQRTPRPRVPRWTGAYRVALLHELGFPNTRRGGRAVAGQRPIM